MVREQKHATRQLPVPCPNWILEVYSLEEVEESLDGESEIQLEREVQYKNQAD